jgi:hypothetical protein
MEFPLYDELYAKASKGPTYCAVQQLSSEISSLSAEHHYQIGLIIYHYHKLNNSNSFSIKKTNGTSLPGGKGILHMMNNISPHLKLILAAYVREVTT